MARAEGSRNGEINTTPLQSNTLPRDLLRGFIARAHLDASGDDAEEEIELSLGLSLNGHFGVDPERAKKLTRSSSIADFTNPSRKEEKAASAARMASAPLARACSLPTETEEEWRRRKELQTLRRLEAKRKRSEKQRTMKMARERSRASLEENCEEDKEHVGKPPLGLPTWLKGAAGVDCKAEKGNNIDGKPTPSHPSPQGSNGSQGSSSSGISESDSLHGQGFDKTGMNKCAEVRSPASVHSLPDCERKRPRASITPEKSGNFSGVSGQSPVNKVNDVQKGAREMMRNVLEKMPWVSTRGDGPNGKRVEGFLYRYRKGEEVRIVCVCHGSFLSPAEFVKHAGGGDVAHPLKHIVVNQSSFL